MLIQEYAIEGIDLVFLGTSYNKETNNIVCKFYNTSNNQLYNVNDGSGFKPFFYVKRDEEQLSKESFNHDIEQFVNENKQFEVQTKTLYDGVTNKEINVYKLMCNNPFSAYKRYREILPNQYEYLIKYPDSYSLSKFLIPCCTYQYKNGNVYQVEPILETSQEITLRRLINNVTDNTKVGYNNYVSNLKYYISLLSQPVPFIQRCAIDIEVASPKGQFPNLKEHNNPITAVSFVTNDGYKKVLTYPNKETDLQEILKLPEYIEVCYDEYDLLQRTFEILDSFPVILTYNGDNFDLAYIDMRSRSFPQLDQSKNPIQYKPENVGTHIIDSALLRNGIHIDLYRMFRNISLHTYAFNKKYTGYKLDEVAQAMIGERKIEVGDINELPIDKLCEYCLHDAEITLKLTTYSDDLVFKLLFTIARITKTPLEDIDRYGISYWAKLMLFNEHRKNNVLIPSRDDLKKKGEGETKAKISGKKFQGAFVMEPEIGSHFNVVVLDFASLYPTIIKNFNLSYETINCSHVDCETKNNVKGTTHYYCSKKQGMLSLIIGVLRDLRVEYFKKLSKDKSLTQEQRDLYDAISQAAKVILNGSYGVVGSEAFSLYCLPVAEAVTAIGRNVIQSTIEFANQQGIKVLYSDTDSLFVLSPTEEQIKKMIDFTKTKYSIDLEIDKTYKYIIFSDRKKNYFGVHTNGKIDTKGLTGKKSNIPEYIKKCFVEMLDVLKDVNNQDELNKVLTNVESIVKRYITDLRNKNYNIEDLTFHSMVNKDLSEYGDQTENYNLEGGISKSANSIPQHIKIALELQKQGEQIGEKTSISYIKTTKGAKQVKYARKQDVDVPKYIDTFKTALEPILDTLNINFDKVAFGTTKQIRLDSLL